MKLLQFISMALISLFMVQILSAQTAVGSCNSVTVTSEPSYETNLIIAGGWKSIPNNNCQIFNTYSPITYSTPRHWLEMKQPNGTWSIVQGGTLGVFTNTFSVTTHGTYRVRFQIPRRLFANGCPQNSVEVLNYYGPGSLGWRGTFSTTPLQDVSWSNEVVVGATVQSDISWTFVDANGNDLFSPGQSIIMNTANTKNYQRWWVGIFENGGQNRWWSNGWIEGPIPGNQINLSAYNPFSGGFQQIPVSYTVQFAISANCNTEWTALYKNFAVCPVGLGCRIADDAAITLFPNPANNSFQLLNLGIDPNTPQQVTISDVGGRTVKSFGEINQTEFDISELTNGFYIVNVWTNNQKSFTGKLSVVK